jgi:hypothetical protein
MLLRRVNAALLFGAIGIQNYKSGYRVEEKIYAKK